VLAVSLKTGARSRARGAYADSSAVQWLTRNARLVRHFLASLSILRRCAGQAGYLALSRARSRRWLRAAPRRLTFAASSHTPAVAPATRGPDRMRLITAPARL